MIERMTSTWLLAKHVLQIVGAAAIGFFFIVVVMTATAQQDVLARMKAENLAVGYSSALNLRSEAKAKAAAVPALRATEGKLAFDQGEAQSRLEESQHALDEAWGEFRPSLTRITHAGLCDLSLASADTPYTRLELATEVDQCKLDIGAPTSSARMLSLAQSEGYRFSLVAKGYFDQSNHLSTINRQLAFTRQQLAAKQALTDDQQKALRSFGDMDVLLQPWVLFGHFFVQFPPALLQFLLTYVSGLFGALLVTLILIVYPSNLINAADNARPVTRTFLGGFIALCVYIVLLSGTAVLGAESSGGGAGTNYMAFCGIGILAGMFSDRVAGWLSKQADEFFKK